jgi:hypothetical protein
VEASALPPDRRNAGDEQLQRQRLTLIENEIAELDRQLKTEFPDYFEFANPTPSSVEGLQHWMLGDDEALILLLDTPETKPTPEETFIWIVSSVR